MDSSLFTRLQFKIPYYRSLILQVIFIIFFFLFNGLHAQNPISVENALTGNPSSEWDITGSGDLSIQGFPTTLSVDGGETIDFKIDVQLPQTDYTIKIYRLGYYNGSGARLVADLGSFTGIPQPQPLYEIATGKTDCSNWSVTASWNTTGFISGIYLAKLTRVDNNGSSHIAFIVRNDDGEADLLFKTSDATWQAYNGYGGNSLYVNNSGTPIPGFNHATKVSYNRPFYTRSGGGGSGSSEDWLFNAEYPMIRWLERNGYHVSYTTDIDMDVDPKQITPNGLGNTYAHKVLLSVGHDEYWSAAERTKFENARNSGVHLAFFSGNEVYWKTRWEDNHRTLVCYKEGVLGENVCGDECDPSENWTGLWRGGCTSSAIDACNPENGLTGQISWGDASTSIVVPDTFKNLRFWRNTAVANLASGASLTLPYGTLGYEFDFEHYFDSYPKGRILMSNTTATGKTHKLSLYRHQSGALVFGAGTVQWSWGLDDVHDRGNEPPSQAMQQATVNLFTDMGVLPHTLQNGLSITNPIDTTAPTAVITFPLHAASLPQGTQVEISGTVTDVDGVVAGVEVSLDGGLTWNVASGTTNFTYSWTPLTQGAITLKVRAFDDNGNIEIIEVPSVNVINVEVTEPELVVCPCSVFAPTATPTFTNANDNNPIELGMKFQSTVDGFVTGVRFYKSSGDTGLHIGNLWTASGTLLATIPFSSESASGWQQMEFSSPIAITSNTTYVVSYFSSNNIYSYTQNYFTDAVINGNLIGLADGTNGGNGVYKYSANSTFPNETYQKSNYWVDVVFSPSNTPDSTAPLVSSVSPSNGSTNVAINTHPTAVFNEALNPTTVTTSSVLCTTSGNVSMPGTVSYAGNAITFTPSNPWAYATSYTITLTNSITDVAGNALATEYSWSFTTTSAPPPLPTEGPGGPILVISASTNPFSRYTVELLRAEGFNEFAAMDITAVTETVLNAYDVIILGEIPVDSNQVTLLSNWVNAGGTLIAFRPNALLAPLLGIIPAGGNLSDKYLLMDTSNGPGFGLVNQTIQFHSAADYYTLDSATALATLYSDATTPTIYPVVTTNSVGGNGGNAIAFTYDLAKSIVYTRQGNPQWAGQERDGATDNIRSSDLFFPDWIDLNKVAIPQADEQQRLLSNIILQSNLHRKPLPRFWFLPRKLKAAVVMTGDDHNGNGTITRFNQYLGYGNNTPEDVLNWNAIRGTSYIYTENALTNAQAVAFNDQGFEIALHLNTNCTTYTFGSLTSNFTAQLPPFTAKYFGIPSPTTNRTHCISWSDWASKPKVEVANGIRLNTDYYYWPADWVQNRPGMFTGSGMPMRFADVDGTIIDNYQVTTQMPDESGLSFPSFIDALLDNAIGTNGYYGVFCANMHTDAGTSSGSDAIIASAIARQIPVVSAKQMLTWLDGRNASSFEDVVWDDERLSFSIVAANGSHQMQAMIPVISDEGPIASITFNGSPLSYSTEIIKGINYAFFDANTGDYVVTYDEDVVPVSISSVVATPNSNGTATITWTTNVASNSTVSYGTTASNLNLTSSNANQVTNHSVALSGLSTNVPYYFRVSSTDTLTNNSDTEPESPDTLSFIIAVDTCFTDSTASDFELGTLDASTVLSLNDSGEIMLKPSIAEAFTNPATPIGLGSFSWTGGTTTFANGSISVNGARFNTIAPITTFAPESVIEFTATFGAASFQHIGLGGGSDATGSGGIYNGEHPWIMFSTGNSTAQLQVRTYLGSAGTTNINIGTPGQYIGTSHVYRIHWKSNSVDFYIDGVLVNTTATIISSSMRVAVSDYQNDGTSLVVDSIQATPYQSEGTYESRIYDAGVLKTWQTISWTDEVPSGTSVEFSQRQSDSVTAILGEPWIPVASNGTTIGTTSQFIQYKVELATSDALLTPVVKDVSISCSTPLLYAQTFCAGVVTSPIALPETPGGVTYTISGGSTIGLADQIGVTQIPSFTPSAGSATIGITPVVNGCVGATVTTLLTVQPATTWYRDVDADGWGHPTISQLACVQPDGYVANNSDCDTDINNNPSNVCSSVVQLKLFIEGYYDATNPGFMKPVKFNQNPISPITEVADVTVELRDATDPNSIVATTTAVLKTNGDAVCTFTSAPSGSFYLCVKGSNFLETWTALPVTVGTTAVSYDFSNAANKAAGDNMALLATDIYGFFSGELNGDGNIDNGDYSIWETDANNFEFGVFATDLNGDGSVDNIDYSIWETNANNFVFSLRPTP